MSEPTNGDQVKLGARKVRMLTLLLVIIVILLLTGGGVGYRRRGRRL
jgi:hypothetical protein